MRRSIGWRSPRWSRRRWWSSWPGIVAGGRSGEGAGGEDAVGLSPSRRSGAVGGLRHSGARVSSARQAKDETIGSQLVAVTGHAERQGLDVPPGWVFTDDGHSGASLVRPGLERLRDLI